MNPSVQISVHLQVHVHVRVGLKMIEQPIEAAVCVFFSFPIILSSLPHQFF